MERDIEEQKLRAAKDEQDRLDRINKEEAAIKRRQAEFSALEKKLALVLPQVNEANLIAGELKRNISFQTKMIRDMPENQNLLEAKTDVVVRVENNEEGYYYNWDVDTIQNRLIVLRDMLN